MPVTLQSENGRELLTTEEVARRLGITPKALATRRYRRQLPKFVKVGAAVRYPVADLEAWINSSTPKLEGAPSEAAAS
ncbi:helix-turn-helix domain-containing protein [bacterium]|nr:helix-turn-helix domain-containing protein [bacterium]